METNFHKAITLSVTYFPQEIATITSPSFSSGGCEWCIMGNFLDKYLSVYISTKEPNKSRGWKRRVNFYFVFLNQSGKEIWRTSESGDQLFCAKSPNKGFPKVFSLKKLLEKGFLVNDSFNLEVYIKVVDGYDMVPSSLFTKQFLRSEKETVDVNGFQVLSSQVISVRQIFSEHPDIAKDLRFKNQVVKTEYINVLLNLLETMKKPLKSISETDLSKANTELCELTEVGFNVEWLKTKLEEVLPLERKKVNAEGYQIQQLEEQVKNLELTVSGLKGEAAKVYLLEKELSDLKTELANENAKSAIATANFVSLKEAFSDLRIELEKEKAKSTSVTAKALSLKRTWFGLKVKKDHKKENSTITDNLLSWEDADLVSPTHCLGNGYKRIN